MRSLYSALAIVAVWVGAATAAPPEGATLPQVTAAWQAAGANCNAPDLAQIEGLIARQREFLDRPAGPTQMMRDLHRQWTADHANASLGFADAALAAGCLEAADRAYRGIISYFVGSAYDGIRQRAMIGIDDVRERRRR